MDPDHPILPFNHTNGQGHYEKHPPPFIFVHSDDWLLGGGFGDVRTVREAWENHTMAGVRPTNCREML